MTVSRRDFFTHFGRSLVREISKPLSAAVSRALPMHDDEPTTTEPIWLRPPGAMEEEAFLVACTKCTDCVEACPYDSIRRLGPEFGTAAGTPAIIPTESPCYLCQDMPCIAACEPRALRPTAPAEVTMGTAVIQMDACYLSSGQPCDYCVTRCPLKPHAIAFGQQDLPVIDSTACAGCGVCAYLCPADAIEIAR